MFLDANQEIHLFKVEFSQCSEVLVVLSRVKVLSHM